MVTLKDAKEVSDVIIETLDPICVVVFGSVAKEGIGEDWDLLIVMEDQSDKSQKIDDPNLLAYKCSKEYYNIYRSRYPAEAGLLPLGEPSETDAERAVGIGKRILKGARK